MLCLVLPKNMHKKSIYDNHPKRAKCYLDGTYPKRDNLCHLFGACPLSVPTFSKKGFKNIIHMVSTKKCLNFALCMMPTQKGLKYNKHDHIFFKIYPNQFFLLYIQFLEIQLKRGTPAPLFCQYQTQTVFFPCEVLFVYHYSLG